MGARRGRLGWEPWLSQCTRVNSKADSSAPRLNAGAGGLGSCDNQGPSVFQVFRCPAGRSPVLVFHVLSPFCAKPGPSTSTLGSTLLALAPPPLRNHPPIPSWLLPWPVVRVRDGEGAEGCRRKPGGTRAGAPWAPRPWPGRESPQESAGPSRAFRNGSGIHA